MDHHVGDCEIREVKHAADHVSVLALNTSLLMVKIDGPANLFGYRQHWLGLFLRDPDESKDPPDDELDPGHNWGQHRDDPTDRPRDGKCKAVGSCNCQCLW